MNVIISVGLIHRQNFVVSMVIVMWIQKENRDVCKLTLFTLLFSGIMSVLKVETDIVASISSSPMGWSVILVIMHIKIFNTDIIIFIGIVIMYLTTHWLCGQFQLVDPENIFWWYQMENVKITHNCVYGQFSSYIVTN